MFTLLRQLPYLQNKKHMLSAFRHTHSRRIPAFWSTLKFADPTNNDSAKKHYGEKEIRLLQEIDRRAPLPGNTGGIPLRVSYTFKIKKVPRYSRKSVETSLPLPEENYESVISQYAYSFVETAMSIYSKMECVAHKCPTLLKGDFQSLFPARYTGETLTVVTLCLKAENDMSTWSEESEKEREILNNQFLTVAKAMTEFLGAKNFWADFIHPTTGKPNSSPLVDDVMFETDLRYRNFGLQIEDLGCCRIISHPIWGTNIFVGAIFTNAPLESFEVDSIKRRTLYPVLTNDEATTL